MTLSASSSRLLHHWVFQGVAITLAGLAVEYGAQFTRSIVLTHRLDGVQFGIASAMAATLTLIDMSTGLGADRFLIQAKDGGSVAALAVAHTLTVGRGVLSGGLLLVLAFPTARLLNIPEYASGFAWLGVIPAIRGFEHLRLAQLQRQHRFLGSTLTAAAANAAGLLAVLAASAVTHDYRAVPWGLGLQAVFLVSGSHIGARCDYRLSMSRQGAERALRFGAPLMVNGLALAAMAQCDRLAVGHFLGVAALGHYTVAAMTFYLPTSLLLRLLVSVAQPRLSAAWHASPSGEFSRVYNRLNVLVAIAAGGFALGVALLGNLVLTKLFGSSYAVDALFLDVYGLFIFMRFAKTSINFGGLAMGRTKDLMFSNLPGIGTLLIACLVLSAWRSLLVVALTSLLGEIIGTLVACYRLRAAISIARFGRSFLLAVPLPVLSGLWVVMADPSGPQRLAVFVGVIALALVVWAVQGSARTLTHSAVWFPRLGLTSGRLK